MGFVRIRSLVEERYTNRAALSREVNYREFTFRNCLKSSLSIVSAVNLTGVQRPESSKKSVSVSLEATRPCLWDFSDSLSTHSGE